MFSISIRNKAGEQEGYYTVIKYDGQEIWESTEPTGNIAEATQAGKDKIIDSMRKLFQD